MLLVALAPSAVEPVRGQNQVEIGKLLQVGLDLGLERQLYAELPGAVLQDLQHVQPADTAEAVAARSNHVTVDVDIDIVPVGKPLEDLLRRHRIVLGEVLESLIGEHHAPAESVVGPIALVESDLVGGVAALHGDGQHCSALGAGHRE